MQALRGSAVSRALQVHDKASRELLRSVIERESFVIKHIKNVATVQRPALARPPEATSKGQCKTNVPPQYLSPCKSTIKGGGDYWIP